MGHFAILRYSFRFDDQFIARSPYGHTPDPALLRCLCYLYVTGRDPRYAPVHCSIVMGWYLPVILPTPVPLMLDV